MRKTILLMMLVLAASVAQADEVAAAARGSGISVVGVATTQVKPSVIEISATLSAEGELANDARVKERDARQRIVDALAVKSPDVSVEFRGLTINPIYDPGALAMQRQQQLMMQNGVVVQMQQNQMDTPRRIGVTEQVRLVMKDADKLDTPKLVEAVLRLIDTARESGLQVGQLSLSSANIYSSTPTTPPAPLIVCKAANTSEVRAQAYKAAIDDARKKAQKLADLSGVKIGKVIGIQEMDPAGTPSLTAPPVAAGQDGGLSSILLGELSVNVKLGVQFEIVN
ncbi:MAG TPA: SIMPL domain-containing protein [Tepidisphaeraceae bacterium]|jgi:uncharacterized protein YggE